MCWDRCKLLKFCKLLFGIALKLLDVYDMLMKMQFPMYSKTGKVK